MYAAVPGPIDELRPAGGGRIPRTEKELANKLKSLGVDVAAIQAAIDEKAKDPRSVSSSPKSSDRITW